MFLPSKEGRAGVERCESRAMRRLVKYRTTDEEFDILAAAAYGAGVSIAEFVRSSVLARSIELVIAGKNRPGRIRPGGVLWSVLKDGTFAASYVATGAERVWFLERIEVPAQVSPTGIAWRVDWVLENGKGGRDFIVSHAHVLSVGVLPK